MAVNTNPKDSKLKITFSLGTGQDGKEITRSKTYSYIKSEATDEDIYAVASALTDMQKDSVLTVERLDQKEITEEE